MRRIAELDALRGIAAVVILAAHLGLALKYPVMGTAVDLFFVLSGFLITAILLNAERSTRTLGTFYIRRSLRIWPIYYLGIALGLTINAFERQPTSINALPYYLTYTQFISEYGFNIWHTFPGHMFHTWTLAIEEQFYLFWPLLVLIVGRRGLFVLLGPLLLGPLLMRLVGFEAAFLPSRCDGLLLGSLLAVWKIDAAGPQWRRAVSVLGFGVVAAVALAFPLWMRPAMRVLHHVLPMSTWPRIPLSLATFQLCLLYFAVVGLVVLGAGHKVLAPLRGRLLCYLGRISYGLYLYHPFAYKSVMIVQDRLGIATSPWIVAAKVALSFAMAALSWHLIEQPILAWRDRRTTSSVAGNAGQSTAGLFRGPHTRLGARSGSEAGRRERA